MGLWIVAGIVLGSILVAVLALGVIIFGKAQGDAVDSWNKTERQKLVTYREQHETGNLPCSDPDCSQCVHGRAYHPQLFCLQKTLA